MKNLKTIIIVFVSVLYSSFAIAQDFGTAIFLKNDQEEEGIKIHNELVKILKEKANPTSVLYDWNKSTPILIQDEKLVERPCEFLVLSNQKIGFSNKYKPSINTKVDTNGVVTSASFDIFYNIDYSYKVLNVSTGEIIAFQDLKIPGKSKGFDKPVTIDVKKYYGKGKLTTDRKKLNLIEKRLYKDYKKAIVNKRNKKMNDKIAKFHLIPSTINTILIDDIYLVKKNPKIDGYNKTVTIDTKGKAKLVKNNLLEIYSPKTIAGKKTVEKVTYVEIDTATAEMAIGSKIWIQSKKKFSKRLELYDELYGVKDKRHANKIISGDVEKVYISFASSNTSKRNTEKRILNIPSVALIERGHKKELNFLRNKYKDDKFIDYNLSDLQDKLIGVQYILTSEMDNINVTDVATGKQLSVDSKEGRHNWFNPGYTTIQSLNMSLMKILDSPIEFLEVIKQKKDKVKSIRIYHPISFEGTSKLDISILKSETIGGKTYERKEYIAKGYVYHTEESPNIGEMKINKKGRKALGQALKNGEKLDFMYSIKRD